MSCSKNNDNSDDDIQQSIYINYSVTGNQVNNTFNIVTDIFSNPSVIAVANIFPESNSQTLKKAVIVYNDINQSINASLSIPARTGLTEVLDGHTDFDLLFGFSDLELGLEAKSISVEVLQIEHNDIYATSIKGSFQGIAVDKVNINGDEIEETYIVDGEFEYNVYSNN
ncbi:hypothetical protein SAMN04489796_1076 [Winogradskyella thalassocola]|uniref:Uncharacterized protein n=2 Tax=Winogradskyella thalassocola TaxID=262004 RepID=A0A1G8HPC2_9FLAO|nr:hypothetical protein SAMN04489796_1076 [Winogradskyella thalassocola]